MARSFFNRDRNAIRTALPIVALMFGIVCVAASRTRGQPTSRQFELSLIVTDKDNRSINSIKKEDIHVFTGRVEQSVVAVEADTRPVDSVIAIDATGSFRSFLVASLAAARLLIENKRPADEILIERFISSDKIEKFHDFTTDGNALIDSFKLFKLEGGQSAVVDAIYTAVDAASEHNKAARDRRKAVVVFTDGEDRNSFYTTAALLKLLRERNVQVFAIGVTLDLDREAGLVRKSPREKAEKLLKSVAEASGGRMFFPKDGKELTEAVTQIIHDLRAQFRVIYRITVVENDPAIVDVKVSAPNGEKRSAIISRGRPAASDDAANSATQKESP